MHHVHLYYSIRKLEQDDEPCLKINLSSVLPKGKFVKDLQGHQLKVSANGVWPLRLDSYLNIQGKAEIEIAIRARMLF